MNSDNRYRIGSAVGLLALLMSAAAYAGNSLTLGTFTVDPPTLMCLAFHWEITGDDNRNATAEVRYREKGTGEWKSALPLLRIGGFHVGRTSDWLDQRVPEGLAGSILDLRENTGYEVQITARDPDGVNGAAVQSLTLRTRAEPRAISGGNVYHVFPADKKPSWTKNQFPNLYKAYYGGLGNAGDFNMVWERPVEPGDTILVHAGVYQANLNHYTDPMCVVPDGTYWLTARGTAEKPITIKAAGDGEVIFDGSGCEVLFNMMAADHHVIEGITFRNCGYAIFAGQQRVGGSVGLTVKNCRFENVRDGIYTLWNGSKDYLISDNVFIGRNDREKLTGWGKAGDGFLKSNTAITLQGTGHVVRHNAMAYFWQAYHMGTAFQGWNTGGVACDLYNNDVYMMVDDGFEIDGGIRNIRVLRNSFVLTGSPISAQPVYGGPVYVVRNFGYGTSNSAFKIHEAWPSGMWFFNNTMVANQPVSRGTYSVATFHNNLLLAASEKGAHMAFPSPGNVIAADHNGYNAMNFVITQIDARTPIMDKQRNPFWPLKPYPDKDANRTYQTLGALTEAAGLEANGVMLDFDAFVALPRPVRGPQGTPAADYAPGTLNPLLPANSQAIDKGIGVPNVTDIVTGKAPDLGAFEYGTEMPHYGPRTMDGIRNAVPWREAPAEVAHE